MLDRLSALQNIEKLYQWLQHMRDLQPVWFDESSSCWHVFRFTDVNTVITEHHLFRQGNFVRSENTSGSASTDQISTAAQKEHSRGVGPTILTIDPPHHRKFRNLLSPLFTPHALLPRHSVLEKLGAKWAQDGYKMGIYKTYYSR